jgi:predicted Zn-dependent peptidase
MPDQDTLIEERVVTRELESGLTVAVVPRRGQRRTYATFATAYGSIDSHFRLPTTGEPVDVPDGIAHFLEHKMFEKPGRDILQEFGRFGASANAYTEYLTTTYLFSTTSHPLDCLTLLLDYVQDPYFTPETVEKEKGIIEQEIRMYLDMPGDRIYADLMEALYVHHPVRLNIAGTVDTIRQITADMLYKCYQTFYHPSNMWVVVVGDLDPEAVLDHVAANQARKGYRRQPPIPRFLPDEPAHVERARTERKMSVALPVLAVGYKDPVEHLTGETLIRRELATDLMWDMVLGKSSPLFFALYRAGLINDRFGARYSAAPSFAHSVLSGETPNPDQLLEALDEGFRQVRFEAVDLDRQKRKELGDYVATFDNPGQVAYLYNSLRVRGVDLFSYREALEQVTLADVEARWHDHVRDDRRAVSVIWPEADPGA